ncbi:MAG TPA: isochorismatase family cysteine hydrolase [Hyphomicrobiales bacterium]|nr:isochorismatase family cysteine hydrolase [Hyphomicrobiales bacterium]
MFEGLDPTKTAHIVVDLQNGFMAEGATVEVPTAREIVPNVNAISKALRAAGGLVVYIRFITDKAGWSTWYTHFNRGQRLDDVVAAFTPGNEQFELWAGLDVQPEDLIVDKTRFGAFVPGSSELDAILKARGIDTLIITGTATNVCCESTARDAMQMNYKVIFVADGNAAMTDVEHATTLNNMAALFADVMTADELVGVLSAAPKMQAAE